MNQSSINQSITMKVSTIFFYLYLTSILTQVFPIMGSNPSHFKPSFNGSIHFHPARKCHHAWKMIIIFWVFYCFACPPTPYDYNQLPGNLYHLILGVPKSRALFNDEMVIWWAKTTHSNREGSLDLITGTSDHCSSPSDNNTMIDSIKAGDHK